LKSCNPFVKNAVDLFSDRRLQNVKQDVFSKYFNRKEVLTLPNLISVARLGCIPWFAWLLLANDDRVFAGFLLGVLGATDWIDGWIARRFNQVSELGKILDPTADRLLLIVAVPVLIFDGSVPIWFAVAAVVREALVGVAALLLASLGARRIDVTWWGKTSTFAMMWAFPCFLLGESGVYGNEFFTLFAWISGLPGLIIAWFSAAQYVPLAKAAYDEGRSPQK
jgi:cardiolipin synthase